MTITAFEGPAGTGKTHSLLEQLKNAMRQRPLTEHGRVLALTFMHGSRRRLDARLQEVETLDRRFQAETIDGFAWRLCQRWQMLARSLGHAIPNEGDYNGTCALAARLLARPAVSSWIGVSYPYVIVDEAQDLSIERSSMIREAIGPSHVFLGFDEFQCLDPNLRPPPIEEWVREHCDPVRLDRCMRTENAELLEAARAVRDGRAVNTNGRRFKVAITPSVPFAATYLANSIAWRQGGDVAVLTPSRRGGFAQGAVELVRTRALGPQQNGPFNIEWESTDADESETLRRRLTLPANNTVAAALLQLEPHTAIPAIKVASDWIKHQRRVLGVSEISADAVHRTIDRALSVRRRIRRQSASNYVAMTIQQAKNQEFDHVVIVWPHTVPNNNEQKRRLLYNAITRARRSCLVLVQAERLAEAPPFTA